MITLKDFMEITDYGITGCSEYMWNCYGEDVYTFDSWDGNFDGNSASVVIDLIDQTVYEITVIDYKKNNAYRYILPEYLQAFKDEADTRNIRYQQAYDDIDYIDIEDEAKFLERMKAIVNGEDYDDRVEISINLDEKELYELMVIAHEKDITLNQLINEILKEHIEKKLFEPPNKELEPTKL